MSKVLHDEIMNLPCKRTMSHFVTVDDLRIYKEGHRDARHAAAELALSADETQSELAAARALLREVSDLGLYIEPNGRMSNECEELTSKIYDYLDACNTPEGAPNAG